ncbi:SDR family NAD(P)-dependent oxidoreductase [Terriglobus sp. 2YAB30_2]|uniref:SDR family NAD(P)-dependent oxidoreductase n=1 Tax=unclassified Terriglobus TaxID=2628988 RepID=UPI003F975A28
MEHTSQFATYPSLRDRVVLVSGGATGIGEAIVEAFARQGARVAFLDLHQEAGEALALRLQQNGFPAPLFLRCDLTDTTAAQQALRAVETQWGALDVLVNNAGNDIRHSLDEVTPERWDELMAVNLKHQFFLSQAALPGMRQKQHGSIVNMGSISWVIPSTDLPVYTTAKAAIVGLTKTLAHLAGKDNVRVNCVMPGAILTEKQQRLWLTPEYTATVLGAQAIKRMILPEEVARLVLFLASDDSAAITNQCHVIDGGWI